MSHSNPYMSGQGFYPPKNSYQQPQQYYQQQQQPQPVLEPSYIPTPPEVAHDPHAFGQFYDYHLSTLTFNSKQIITALTLLAQENVYTMANVISASLERHLMGCPPPLRLPAFYLLDSISKNLGPPYIALFSRFVPRAFMSSYQIVEASVKLKLLDMLATWATGAPDGGELFRAQGEPMRGGYIQREIEHGIMAYEGTNDLNQVRQHLRQPPAQAGYYHQQQSQLYPSSSAGQAPALDQNTMAQQLQALVGNGDIKALLAGLKLPLNNGNSVGDGQGGQPSSDAYRSDILRLPFSITDVDLLKFNPADRLFSFLYDRFGLQCTQCGIRFIKTDDGKKRMDSHLDWHFTNKRRISEGQTRNQSRSWFISEDDFISSSLHGGVEDDAQSVSTPTGYDSDSNDAGLPPAETKEELLQKKVIVPSDPTELNQACPICQEQFKLEFSETDEEWVYFNAINVDGTLYHATCHSDKAISEAVAAKKKTSTASKLPGKSSLSNVLVLDNTTEEEDRGNDEKPFIAENTPAIKNERTLEQSEQQTTEAPVVSKEESTKTVPNVDNDETEEPDSEELELYGEGAFSTTKRKSTSSSEDEKVDKRQKLE